MFSFRCTRRLINKLQASVVVEPPQPTTRLGDWYGNFLFSGYHRLLMFVSDRSLLPVLMPLRERNQLLPSFRARLAELLLHLEISEKDVALELSEMAEAVLARTANRSILGSMNDFTQNTKAYMQMHDDFSLLDLELWLAETPCGPKEYRYPNELTIQLLTDVDSRRKFSAG